METAPGMLTALKTGIEAVRGKRPRVLLDGALDLVYPSCCESCGAALAASDRGLCWDCLSGVQLIQPPFCSCCGNPASGRIDHAYRCHLCTANRPAYRQARSAVRHEGVIQELLMAYKYNGALWVEGVLKSLLTACISSAYRDADLDMVVPVPLFPARKRERGFNQAERLAEHASDEFSIPLMVNVLRRIRPTGTQTRLTARQRISNVRGAFRVVPAERVREKNILLVDDVMTTGATVHACAGELMEAGAKCVLVATVARR